MPVPSTICLHLNSSMNTQQFFEYLTSTFDETFASFIIKDLNIMKPSILTSMTSKELHELIHMVYPQLNTSSKSYYIVDPTHKDGGYHLKRSVLVSIQDLKKELNPDSQKKRKNDATLTTNSSEISDSDISVSQIKTNLPTKRHIERRRTRHKKAEPFTSSSHDKGWSFSSDEYEPPSLDELFPSKDISAKDRADFEIVTYGRMDYFCYKYLYLTDVTEIRRFQHLAQVQLGMHKEHLYEFMHFIRGSPDILRGLQQTAKQLTSEKTSGKIIILVNYLTDIKVKQKFVNIGYEMR